MGEFCCLLTEFVSFVSTGFSVMLRFPSSIVLGVYISLFHIAGCAGIDCTIYLLPLFSCTLALPWHSPHLRNPRVLYSGVDTSWITRLLRWKQRGVPCALDWSKMEVLLMTCDDEDIPVLPDVTGFAEWVFKVSILSSVWGSEWKQVGSPENCSVLTAFCSPIYRSLSYLEQSVVLL